uniref:hexokinase n=1 Tax=Timema shepardi TaxID=629360 RepID=A0A7R9AVT1_TIMSH|nr:unnamed protein product [Timema shepardi]
MKPSTHWAIIASTSIQRLGNIVHAHTNLYPDTNLQRCCASTPTKRISPVLVPFAIDPHIAAGLSAEAPMFARGSTPSDVSHWRWETVTLEPFFDHLPPDTRAMFPCIQTHGKHQRWACIWRLSSSVLKYSCAKHIKSVKPERGKSLKFQKVPKRQANIITLLNTAKKEDDLSYELAKYMCSESDATTPRGCIKRLATQEWADLEDNTRQDPYRCLESGSARSIPRRDVTPVEWLQAIGSRLPRQPIGSRFLVGSSLRRSPPPSQRNKPSRSLSLHLGVLIREECQELVLSDGQVLEIMKRLLTELNRGLGKATHDTADVKCFTTFVQDLPNGTVLYVSWQLFDHIAECLANFMVEHDLSSERLPLGFTFSFPLSQRGLTKGYLVQWTKGFDCSDCINEDVVQMLKDAIARRNDIQLDVVALLNDAVGTLVACAVRAHNSRVGLIVGIMDVKIDVCAILNDTTGTLMSCAWKNFNCRIGIIVVWFARRRRSRFKSKLGVASYYFYFALHAAKLCLCVRSGTGTGSNACYVEKVENVELFEGDKSKPYMVINTEWGAFGDNGALEIVRTQYDREIDSHSINAGKQLHEKMISGMYMGELVRLVLVKFTKSNLLFGGKGSDMLFERGTFFTKFVSEIESDKRGTFTGCRQFDLMLSEDGSGRGAALVAAVACRDR